ncbi:RNA polymerase subunit sigma [Kurthia sibirica]|uniref:RNA polymerase subunit sigma n=1 Tax=Kurthia sibirica TaxID=202750 RepID=A0A2U3AQV0_9BACL|nr:RNA polymerase subunit sigma [Kurthia sibirica]PWI26922.1 RNA polymerase subunit sigma [Kurthia sibirica]GEK32536.1 hypothetical protein KSI01_00690 [Kurthia sibirica]
MSLKGVELQIAIPKTFDAGKQQDQAQQQVHAGQAFANESLNKQLQKNHTLLLASEELHNDLRHDHPQDEEKDRKEQENEEPQSKHPYKGNLFDFSG